jgi:hypothetical protein
METDKKGNEYPSTYISPLDEVAAKMAVPWGITRLFAALGTILVGAWVMVRFVAHPSLMRLFKPLAPLSLDGVVAIAGLAASMLLIAAFFVMLAFLWFRPLGAASFLSAVYDRNWLGYRIEYWLYLNGNVGYKITRGHRSYGEQVRPHPECVISVDAWLSGQTTTRTTLIRDWRRAKGNVVGGSVVLGLSITRPKPPSGFLEWHPVMLADADGNTATIGLHDALEFWIPQALASDPPSLAKTAHSLYALYTESMRQQENFARQVGRMQQQLDSVTEGRENLQKKFAEQHALADAAIRIIWDAIWAVYNTRRLDGVRSKEGMTVRSVLTCAYQKLALMPGHERHTFQTDRLPAYSRPQSKRVSAQ